MNIIHSSLFDWSKFGIAENAANNTKYSHKGAVDIVPADSIAFEQILPFVAAEYSLSKDPADYFFRPTIGLVSDLPNRNGAGFPLSELVRWNPQQGRQGYKTWQGKPMFEEHGKYHPDPNNPDHRLALGFVADVELLPVRGYGNDKVWKVLMLAAVDRTAGYKLFDKELPALYESGEVNSVSMGCLVSRYTCAYCGHDVGRCTHIDEKEPVQFKNIAGRLAYRLCHGLEGVELSIVKDPAAGMAVSDAPAVYLSKRII